MNRPNVESILEDLVTLPSLPSSLGRILELIEDPDVQLSDVGKVIARDPALSLKILRLVNSAYLAMRDKVTSVDRAVVLLGLKTTRNVVLTASVFDSLKCGEESLLQHAIACATAGRMLTRHVGSKSPFSDPEEAFMYGLLHDVGKIIMQSRLPDEWSRIAPKVSQGKFPAFVIEKQIVGVDHCELGALLAQRWKLQPELVAAIASHHDLTRCETAEQRRRAAYIGIFDQLCYRAGYPALAHGIAPETPGVWDAADLTPDQVEPVIAELEAAGESINQLLGLAS